MALADTIDAQITSAVQKIADNSDWFTTNSVSKAAAFAEGCNMLLVLRTSRASHGGAGAEEIQFDQQALKAARDDALKFTSQSRQVAAGGVQLASFEFYRD